MIRRSNFFTTPWFLASLLVAIRSVAGSAQGQVIWYVDDDAAGGSGTSWANAFRELQDALAVAQSGDEIRIAQGIYTPAPAGRARSATFRLTNGLAIYGGYAGVNRPVPDLRSVQSYPTILSGDLNGDDGFEFLNNQENSYHVVTSGLTDESTLLDGIIITAGNANSGDSAERFGGGMVIDSGSPTLRQCTFGGNRAAFFGGGLYNAGGSPSLIDCTFVLNEAVTFAGGGMANFEPNCTATLTNCRFIANTAPYGGGMENAAGAAPVLFNCVFIGNSAGSGGAIDISGGAIPSFTGCTITHNVASAFGGGIHAFVSDARPPFDWPEDTDRRAMPETFASPLASIRLTNCIAWGNTDVTGSSLEAQLTGSEGSIDAFDVAYSCVRSLTAGLGNIGIDPRFMDADGRDDIPGTLDDDIRLRSDSPCIDMGDPEFKTELNATDALGHPRVLCGRVDIGATESGIGDLDCDRDVDLVDFGGLQSCFTDAGEPRDDACATYDFDGDGDVDLDDYGGFGEAVTSPSQANNTAEEARRDGWGESRT